MIGSSRDKIGVDDAGLVHIDSSTGLEIELTFGNRGHPASLDPICPSRNFHAMANARNRFVVINKPLRHFDEILVLADIFRSTATGK